MEPDCLGTAAALALSISLAGGMGPEVCKAVYQWTIFGMPFPFFGTFFFAICLLLFHLRDRPPARVLLAVLIAGAWGAEATFLYVQHSVIKIWCPICLAVALCVLVAGIALALPWFPGGRQPI